MLSILDTAPEFKARAALGADDAAEVSLSDHAGRWVVLFFYPKDFTVVCPTELSELSKRRRELQDLGAGVIALSTDALETHQRWIREKLGPLGFPLAADPDRRIARAYGVLLEREGVAGRATFVVDPGGRIRYAAMHDLAVGRSVSEILRVLEALQTGEHAPAEWTPGTPTLGR